MVRRSLAVAWIPVLVLLPAACTPETPRPDPAELDALLQAAVDDGQVPVVMAMVAARGGTLYQGGAGVANDAIFSIASMTKQVTSVAVMQLVEAGEVELDEPAETYVPALKAVEVLGDGARRLPSSAPTVRQLLSHTAGFSYEFLSPAIAEEVESGRLVSGFTGTGEFLQAPLVADPGTRWEYGINTDWLARLLESVSGQSLDEYFRSNIFEPLGMTDTYYNVPSDKQHRIATVYARQPDGSLAAQSPEPLEPTTFFPGGHGLYSTAADYLRFARALLAGGELDGQRILEAETVALMARNQIADAPLPGLESLLPDFILPNAQLPGGLDGFGLGFGLNREPRTSARGAGTLSWAGVFNTFFWVDRERDICAVVFTQMLPFGDPGAVRLVDDFERAVYRLYR